jgi:phage major head subunit gpT-like protein
MALDTAHRLAALNSLTAKFDEGARAYRPFYPRICTIRSSKRKEENYGMLGNMPKVREWIGERLFQRLRAASYLLANKDWEDSLEIDKNDLDDDLLDIYGDPLSQMGNAGARHPDELLFQVVTDAENQACLDGQAFYDTDHSWGEFGVQSNKLSATAAAPAAPTVSEWETAFNAAIISMMGFKDDQGRLFHAPTFQGDQVQLIALVPPTQLKSARTAMGATIVNNTTHVTIAMAEVIGVPFFTSATKFQLLRVDTPLRPFIFQARRPLTRQMKGRDDIEHKDIKFMTWARYNVGLLAWWNAVQTTFA